MAVNTQVSVSDWLAVRDRVSRELKAVSPRSEKTIEMTERLMTEGVIDVDEVLKKIEEAKAPAQRKAVAPIPATSEAPRPLPEAAPRPQITPPKGRQ